MVECTRNYETHRYVKAQVTWSLLMVGLTVKACPPNKFKVLVHVDDEGGVGFETTETVTILWGLPKREGEKGGGPSMLPCLPATHCQTNMPQRLIISPTPQCSLLFFILNHKIKSWVKLLSLYI